MQIQEYRPEQPRLPPPAPPRQYRSRIIFGLFLAGVFFGTIAFEERHEIGEYVRQSHASSVLSQVPQPIVPISAVTQKLPLVEIARNVTLAVDCIPSNALTIEEIQQLTQELAALPASAGPAAPESLETATFERGAMTLQQAMGFLKMLEQVKGPLGEKARAGFNQSISNGPCRIGTAPVQSADMSRTPTQGATTTN